MLGAALQVGVTPVEIKEILYQAVAYTGMARVFAQRVSMRLQRSQAQAFRASMARAGGRDIELEADQAEAHRMVLDQLLEVPELLDAVDVEEEDGGLCFG